MKTQKASNSFVWAGFIASWFMTSPARRPNYTLDWFHMCFKTYHAKRSQSVSDATEFPWKGTFNFIILQTLWEVMGCSLNILKQVVIKMLDSNKMDFFFFLQVSCRLQMTKLSNYPNSHGSQNACQASNWRCHFVKKHYVPTKTENACMT